MGFFRNLMSGAVVVLCGSSVWATPADFEGSFWDAGKSVNSRSNAVLSMIAGSASATSRPGMPIYIGTGWGNNSKQIRWTTLFGDEVDLFQGRSRQNLNRGVFHFVGALVAGNGLRDFAAGNDDWFLRKIDGRFVLSYLGLRSHKRKSVFFDMDDVPEGFELIHFRNSELAALTFDENGNPKPAFTDAARSTAPLVPLPASLPMLGSGLLCLALWKRWGRPGAREVV